MYASVLTGGIACGKSVVANLLRLYGYSVIDADKCAHKILSQNSKLIAAHFGSEVIESSGVNRAKLGQIIFNDKAKKELLESILHPLIFKEITQQGSKLEKRKSPYFMDIPLFFESKSEYKARFIICVYAPKSLQLERLMQRNNLSESDALKRIDSQLDIEIKRHRSDFVIENVGDLKDLQKNVEAFLDKFSKFYA